ncbi:MAG: hypothetical protein IT428_05350 [Planctomycetaceae bacterium]|nr:hypothetical protein [Planctomycetaceae bacterium]
MFRIRISPTMRRIFLTVVVVLSQSLVLPPLSAVAQDAVAQDKATARPLVVVTAASIDRLLEDVKTVAVSADHGDLFDSLKGLLNNVGNFEGADRSRPAGILVFLTGGFPPKPEPIGFVPVADADAFLKTVAFGPIRTKPVEGKTGRHELAGPNGSAFLQFHGTHAMIAPKGVALDRAFPDIEALTKDLATKYDIAARVDLSVVPEGVKQLFLGTVRARVEADQQKAAEKPDSTEEAVRAQKEMSDAGLEMIESAVRNGREVVVGLTIDQTTRSASLEARFVNANGKEAGAPPMVGNLANPASPARLKIGFTVSEKRRPALRDLANAVEKQALAKANPEDAALLSRLFGPLKATMEAGRLDVEVHFVGAAPGPLTMVGGIQMKDADSLARALPELLQKLGRHPNVGAVETNAVDAGEVQLHRLTGRSASANDDRVFGPKPGLLVGAGRETLWFAVAGKSNESDVTGFVSRAAREGTPVDGLQLEIAAGTWVAMSPQAGEESARTRLLRDAFIRGKDRLSVDVTGSPTGPVLKVTVEEGYLRLLGLAIALRAGK